MLIAMTTPEPSVAASAMAVTAPITTSSFFVCGLMGGGFHLRV